jgi:hypothetical protein
MPNYDVTPPQANDLNQVLRLLLLEKKVNTLIIETKELAQKLGVQSREVDYRVNALKWLGLVSQISSEPGVKNLLVTELGNKLINADGPTKTHIIRDILKQDSVFQEAVQYRKTALPLLKNILYEKIISPDSKWRSAKNNILSESSARRRVSCVIAWCITVGFIWKPSKLNRLSKLRPPKEISSRSSFLGLPNDNSKQLEKIRTAIEQLSKIHHPREGFTVGEITQFCKETWPGWRYPPTTSTNVGSSVRRTLQHHCSDAKYGGEGTARTALGIKPGDDKDLFRWHKDQELWSIRKSE